MLTVLDKAKKEFIKMIERNGSDPYGLRNHITEFEKWARYVIKKDPKLDEEVIMLGVYLHDIGHYPIKKEIDHAIIGENIAKDLLKKWKFDPKRSENVLHCIRSHRCKDAMPKTSEAKIIACLDSASHMTDDVYISMAQDGRVDDALAKLERDYRDIAHNEDIKNKVEKMYHSWKNLLINYKELMNNL